MTKKAFFGGSFDPPHTGHLGVAKAALASGKCDEVVWFPGFLPPHKLTAGRAPFQDRFNMVQMLIDGVPGMRVSDFENRLQLNPSYTIEILRQLHRETGEKYMLLIGADSLLNFHSWYQAETLAEEFELIVYPRQGAEITAEKLRAFWDEKTTGKFLRAVIPGKFFEISSSEVRFSMEKNTIRHHIITGDGLPRQIAAYIKEHNLYSQH